MECLQSKKPCSLAALLVVHKLYIYIKYILGCLANSCIDGCSDTHIISRCVDRFHHALFRWADFFTVTQKFKWITAFGLNVICNLHVKNKQVFKECSSNLYEHIARSTQKWSLQQQRTLPVV